MRLAYYNGHYLPLEDIHISPLDRGFLFGDSIYEVLPVYRKKLFCFEYHFKRLQHSLSAIEIPLYYSEAEWRALFQPLITAEPENNFNLYLQVTRGQAPTRSHQYPPDMRPTVLLFTTPHPDYCIEDFHPIRVVTHPDIRWLRCDIKTTALLGAVLLQQYAKNHHAQETILLRGDTVCEAASSNVFIVKKGVLITPKTSEYLLSGITRQLILEIAERKQFPYQVRNLSLTELYAADEVWLTGSNKEIQPVTQVDEHCIGTGDIGPVWKRMIECFFEYKQSLMTHG